MDAASELRDWIADNQVRITEATVGALLYMDGVAEGLTAIDAEGKEKAKQQIEAALFASKSHLPQTMREHFGRVFDDVSPAIRNAVATNAAKVAEDNLTTFVDLIIGLGGWHGNQSV